MPVPHPADTRVGLNTAMQSAAVATGNGSTLAMAGMSRLAVDVNGITTATITFEGSLDGTNFRGMSMTNQAGTVAATATADGVYYLPVAAPPMILFRSRISAYTSGTINALGRASY